MADLDLLRDINNTYGHLAGDAVLQGIAEVFRSHLRHYDVPARFGGEEFAILLPETTPEQAFEIAERIRRTVAGSHLRRRDLERADPRHGLDRRRRVPARRRRRERADPPGRPGRLPRQAPGPQPRARCELRAAADAGEAPEPARRGSGGRRPRRAAASSGRERPGSRAPPPAAARDARASLPLTLETSCGLRRDRQRSRPRGQLARRDLWPQHGLARPDCARRARRCRSGARSRGRRRLDLGQRRRLDCRRRAVRCPRRPRPGDHDRRGGVECATVAVPLRGLQHRHARALLARGGRGLHVRLPGAGRHAEVRLRRGGHRRRRYLLHGQHDAC